MARLTILQASQQGFGSTLTIHRHIKDGTLPVYEDGDTKLLEVDDLISVFGEPATVIGDTVSPVTNGAASGQLDIHEFNRIKAELEQKNKKNMWLSADLAEVVRELKEKEASFEKERNRLLTVLEQAQALLLRESGKGGKARTALGNAGDIPPAGDAGTAALDPAEPSAATGHEPETIADGAPGALSEDINVSDPEASPDVSVETGAGMDKGEQWKPDTAAAAAGNPVEKSLEDLLPKLGISNTADTAANTADDSIDTAIPPGPEGDIGTPVSAEEDAKQEINPMMPPVEDGKPRKSRSIGVSTWIMLALLVVSGFLIFEHRTKVIAGLTKLGKFISGF